MPNFCFSVFITPHIKFINKVYPLCPQNTVSWMYCFSTFSTWSLTQATIASHLVCCAFLLTGLPAFTLSAMKSPHHSQSTIFKMWIRSCCTLFRALQWLPITPKTKSPSLFQRIHVIWPPAGLYLVWSTLGACHASRIDLPVSLAHARHIPVSGSLHLLFILLGMLFHQVLKWFTLISIRSLLKCYLFREAVPHHFYLK